MYNMPYGYQNQYPYYVNTPPYAHRNFSGYWTNPNEIYANFYRSFPFSQRIVLQDYGPNPFVVNINEATKQNETFRTALWTGTYLQTTLMSIPVGGDIGLEMHPNVDQFLRLEQGQGLVRMGKTKNQFDFERTVQDDDAIFIPAGTWHNLINTGNIPLKLYSIYAPPNHPFGTVHRTKAEAMASESEHANNHNTVFLARPQMNG